MTSLFNHSNSTQNNNFQQTQVYTDYPEVFFTQNKSQVNIPVQDQRNQSRRGILGNLNISKDMIGQFLPLILGNNSNTNNILSSLLQSGSQQNEENNILSNLLGDNKNMSQIFNSIVSLGKNNKIEKKDTSNIIDMSDYIEIKN